MSKDQDQAVDPSETESEVTDQELENGTGGTGIYNNFPVNIGGNFAKNPQNPFGVSARPKGLDDQSLASLG